MFNKLILALVGLSLLAGCSGGGDSTINAPKFLTQAFTGSTNQATVTISNAKALSEDAYSSNQLASAVSAAKVVVGRNERSPLLRETVAILKHSVATVVSVPKASSKVAASVTSQNTVYGYNGSITYTLNLDQTTGSFTGTLTFSQYKDTSTSASLNGSIDISGVFNRTSSTFTNLNMIMTGLSGIDGNQSFTMVGTIAISNGSATKTVTSSLVIINNVNGRTYWEKDFTQSLTGDLLTVSGTYYDHIYGYVVVSTPIPLRVTSIDATPTSGRLLFTGTNGTNARMTFTSSGWIVEADTTGTGTYTSIPSATTNQPPVADFSMPTNALRDSVVNIDTTTSKDNYGIISTYTINFGDGTPLGIQATPYFSHSYSNSGTYSVTLTVTDSQGLSNLLTKQITIGVIGSTPVNVSNTAKISQAPKMVSDSNGAINVIWYEYGDTMFSRSVDGGGSFSPGKYVLPIIPGYSTQQAQIATTTNKIHVVSTMFGGAGIVYSKSTDGGGTFSTPVYISNVDSINPYSPSIATDGGSRIGIAWNGGNYFIRSDDGGNTFSTPIKLTDPGPIIVNIAMTDQNTYILYQTPVGQFYNQSQIFFSRSNNNSTDFTSPVNISNSSLQAYGSTIKTDHNGNIYVFWLESPNNSEKRIMYTVSTDNGVSFKTPTRLTDPSLNAICISLGTGSIGQIYAVWSTGEPFSDNFQTYLNYSTDSGVTFSTPLKMPAITNEGNCPQLIDKGSGKLGALWNSPLWSPSNIQGEVYYSNIQVSIP